MTDIVYGVVKALTQEERTAVWKSDAGKACLARQTISDWWSRPLLAFAEIDVDEQVTYCFGTSEARDATYMAQRLTEEPNWEKSFIFSFHPNGDITVTRFA